MKANGKRVIAYRRSCRRAQAGGTGLSHYIMMNSKKK